MSAPSPKTEFASAADHAACRAAIRRGSRSFFAASLLLPRALRRPAYGLYAFCRLSDDAIDDATSSRGDVESLRVRLGRAYAGRPLAVAADRALADLVRRHAIPRAVPEALLEGLRWDADGRRYESLPELHDYAARVAGTVGVMMALLMGARGAEALARAGDLGVAMQLTNIARDVGEDARAGRLYLPLRWLREAGIDPQAFLDAPSASPALRGVVARLLREADTLYARARLGVARLPAACRPAILSAAMVYAEIGRDVEAAGHDSVARRARVSGARKLQLLGQALLAAPRLEAGAAHPPLPAMQFLIDAVARAPAPARAAQAAPRGLRPQMLRVLAIYERLERAERFGEA